MSTPTHIASSYLLSQIPTLLGKPLTSIDVIAIIIAGNIIDLDFIVGRLLGKKGDLHHNFVSHTPIFVLTIYLISFLLFPSIFSNSVWLLILASVILHLIFDNLNYWFYKFGWQEISEYPQINWFYPFKPFKKRSHSGTEFSLLNYLSRTKVSTVLETLLIVPAFYIFLIPRLSSLI